MSSGEPPTKRTKKSGDPLDIIGDAVLRRDVELKAEYVSAKPFPHGRVTNLFQEGFLGTLAFFIHRLGNPRDS